VAILATLAALRDRLRAALPDVAVIEAHAQDMSDRATAKWLVRLPGIYLVAEGVEVRGTDARLKLRAYVLVRMADMRQRQAEGGWAIAETALAIIVADPMVQRAQLIYRDESGLDQPGVALWEIAAERPVALAPIPPQTMPECLRSMQYEAIYSSWAPWIGAAHEPRYTRVEGDAPAVGDTTMDGMLP
jgi:hypothetical protein